MHILNISEYVLVSTAQIDRKSLYKCELRHSKYASRKLIVYRSYLTYIAYLDEDNILHTVVNNYSRTTARHKSFLSRYLKAAGWLQDLELIV